jgi:hypothetical protein
MKFSDEKSVTAKEESRFLAVARWREIDENLVATLAHFRRINIEAHGRRLAAKIALAA